MIRFLERGGIWVVEQFILLACVFLLALWHPGSGPVAWRGFGALVLAVAAGVAAAGAITLGRNLTPFPEPAQHAQLVQSGIYSRVRHPLYTSVMLAGFGWALIWLSWPAALAAVALIPFFHMKSCREECLLRGRFSGYPEYASRTRRFIPWIY